MIFFHCSKLTIFSTLLLSFSFSSHMFQQQNICYVFFYKNMFFFVCFFYLFCQIVALALWKSVLVLMAGREMLVSVQRATKPV